jgi:hypothetical protein
VSQEEQLLLVGEGRLAAAFIHVLGGGLTFLTEIRNQATHRTVARIFRSARLPVGKPGLNKNLCSGQCCGYVFGPPEGEFMNAILSRVFWAKTQVF